MKRIIYALMFMMLLTVAGCNTDSEDTELHFTVESNSNPENIYVGYNSTATSEYAQGYYVFIARDQSGIVELNCTTFKTLTLVSNPQSLTGGYAVSVSGNVVKIEFDPLLANGETIKGAVKIAGSDGVNSLTNNIYIVRDLPQS